MHNRAEESYHLALELATKKLKRYHPLRLGVMLNMSIHYYRIPYDRIKAIQLSMQVRFYSNLFKKGKKAIIDDNVILSLRQLLLNYTMQKFFNGRTNFRQ